MLGGDCNIATGDFGGLVYAGQEQTTSSSYDYAP